MTDKPQRALSDIEPIVVRPRIACRMLGGIGAEHLWHLINSGELESYLDGRARRITVASIKAHIARQLAKDPHDPSAPAPAAQSTIASGLRAQSSTMSSAPAAPSHQPKVPARASSAGVSRPRSQPVRTPARAAEPDRVSAARLAEESRAGKLAGGQHAPRRKRPAAPPALLR
jgi:hypothetical protein